MVDPFITGAALPEMALSALQRGDPSGAYFFADRWIRLAGANAGNLLLRAEAAKRLGLDAAAMDDIRQSLRDSPLNRLIVGRWAEWAEGEERIEAARAWLALSPVDAEPALRLLAAAGESGAGVVRVEGGFASGWLAWRSEQTASLSFAGRRAPLETDPRHPYAPLFGSALSFRVPCEAEPCASVSLDVGGCVVAKTRAPGEPVWPEAEPMFGPETAVTVLVPVYDDYEATRDCLISVAVEVETTPGARALAIDDGAPNPRIRGLLACFADWPGCRVLRNPENLGFVAAVNRGLKRLPHGDVLLLNADARLGYGALARLKAAAASDVAIGLVNPLSNHGEFVSYPRPFQYNEFDEESWREIDRAAASAKEAVIDIPSATGFCSYITRACLDATGALSGEFAEGYLEDADFGLRAREAGFRNVCALSVYAPHIGSLSFKSAKAGLVARNRLTLARRFPDYEGECSAYLKADPLAGARARLEAALASQSPMRRLILGPARWRDLLWRRAQDLQAVGLGVVVGLIEGDRLTLRDPEGAAPQNSEILLNGGEAALKQALSLWPVDRVEWAFAPDAPAALGRALERAAGPLDLIVAYAPRSRREAAFPRHETLYAADFMAERACQSLGLAARRLRALEPAEPSQAGRVDLAVLHPFETPASRRFLAALAETLKSYGRTALLIGAASAEDRLLAEGLLATGPAAVQDWPRLLAVHAPRRLALPYRDCGFWALEEAWRAAAAPAAYFDPAGSQGRLDPDDLPLDPRAEDAAAAAALLDWAFLDRAQTTNARESAAA